MDCHEFDGQVVRLERLQESAEKFVRVRLTRIDDADLNLFEFDYDLTFMVFFLNADGQVYARYGGRDAESADGRQSLDGLHYTMKSVLAMHANAAKECAPKSQESPRYVRDVPGGRRGGGCMHCHQVREVLNSRLRTAGQWTRDLVWRYPLPENLGFALELDRGNVVKQVKDSSPASAVGLRPGDIVRRLHGVPVHSFADAQYALDRAPKEGAIEIAWQRGDEVRRDQLALAADWRKTDISWRASMRRLVAAPRLSGNDLSPDEKKALGLAPRQFAFRQKTYVHDQAKEAGVLAGDIVLGIDDKPFEMGIVAFHRYIQGHYLIGDSVTVNLLRDGKRLNLPLTFVR